MRPYHLSISFITPGSDALVACVTAVFDDFEDQHRTDSRVQDTFAYTRTSQSSQSITEPKIDFVMWSLKYTISWVHARPSDQEFALY